MEEARLAELSRAIDELADKFGVEVVHSESDAVRSAENLWRKRAQQAIERAKKRRGETWTFSDEECVIGRSTSPEDVQALLDKIGIRIVVRTLIEQAYATEGVEPPAPDAPRAAKNSNAA
jgi:hypothetical protein